MRLNTGLYAAFFVWRPDKESKMDQQWGTPTEGAAYVGRDIRTFRGWLKDGLRHSRLPSGHILIRFSDIDEYLKRFEVCQSEIDAAVNELLRRL